MSVVPMPAVTDTLMPWLTRWEQEIARKILNLDGGRHFSEHLVTALLRSDTQARYTAYGQAIKDGWMLRNEARELENMNPIAGLDLPLAPLNMATVNADGSLELPESEEKPEPTAIDPADEPEEEEEGSERMVSSFMPVFCAFLGRAARQEDKRAEHLQKRGGPFEAEMSAWMHEHKADVAESLTPAVIGLSRALCPGGVVPPDKARGIEDLAARCAEMWIVEATLYPWQSRATPDATEHFARRIVGMVQEFIR